MTKSFPRNKVVIATVMAIPTRHYFFAKNGDPNEILCHLNQGGTLQITRGFNLVVDAAEKQLPAIGGKVVLIRNSDDPFDDNFTLANTWVKFEDWLEKKWVANAHATFRAVANDHRTDGQRHSNSDNEVELAKGSLIDIMRSFPRGAASDKLGPSYTTELFGKSLSCKTLWYKLEADGTWTECADPRPIDFQF